jgi:hypothetical protein
MYPQSVNFASSFTLTGPGGSSVAASVAYDASTQTATLTPTAPLAASTTYGDGRRDGCSDRRGAHGGTRLLGFHHGGRQQPAADGGSTSPGNGAPRDDLRLGDVLPPLDPTTINASTFSLRQPDGTIVPWTVTRRRHCDRDSDTQLPACRGDQLHGSNRRYGLRGRRYAARGRRQLELHHRGLPVPALPDQAQPAAQPAGTYELGVKIRVDQPQELTTLRFFKSSGETGPHMATVWSASGVALAHVPFASETASGWQQQALVNPLLLQANTTYVVSVNANSAYAVTANGLASQITNGLLHTVADGANGVYNNTRGSFPNQSYASSNYFVDVVVAQRERPGATKTSRPTVPPASRLRP